MTDTGTFRDFILLYRYIQKETISTEEVDKSPRGYVKTGRVGSSCLLSNTFKESCFS